MKNCKLIFLFIALIGNLQFAFAQQGWFARMDIGRYSNVTTTKAGPDFALELGDKFKGVELSISLSYFSNFKDTQLQSLQYDDYGSAEYLTTTGDFGGYKSCALLDLSVGYDLLHLIKLQKHHFTPFVSVGYCQMSSCTFYDNSDNEIKSVELNSKTDCGCEASLGARYEFDIAKHFSIGAFYKTGLILQESNLFGLSVKYTL